ncbi:MAG: hypothetical protein RL518_2397 [Pseudomonadota bacterium]|jgi:hypothetical protein
MNHSALDAICDELREACKREGIADFSIERAYTIGEGLRAARQQQLASIAPPEATQGEPFDLLLLFDVIAATASLEAASVGGVPDGKPVSSEVIDLWIRATAARTLWSERFMQWPSENSTKKLEHLRDTARKLGAESIARGLVEGVQPIQFTQFVGRLSTL